MENDNSLGLTLHHLCFMLDRQSDLFLLDRFGLGFSQFKILMSLLHRSDVQQREIAEFLGQTESSVSRQVGVLVGDGLVNSNRDINDHRQRVTKLTAKGERLARTAMAELEKHFAPMFETLSQKKQAELAEMLDSLRDYAVSNIKYGYWIRARHQND